MKKLLAIVCSCLLASMIFVDNATLTPLECFYDGGLTGQVAEPLTDKPLGDIPTSS